ncbi:MAG TPA: NAD(P)H-hydrate dehydratase [Thermoplasmatales archaeon]|nr:NAD(P)H-hydrate dehydratase [Thermoplasmatales archaeon]
MEIETKVLDKNAEFFGVSTKQLMENAGKVIADETKKLPYERWLILCGAGNNGGDGYVASRYIKNCSIISVSKPKTKLAIKNFRKAKALGIPIYKYSKEKLHELIEKCDAIIDAMLGVGIKGELKEPYNEIVKILNESGKFILSVDIPTGFGADVMLKSDMTVTFHFIKEGMDEKCGKIVLADIGIPKEAEEEVGIGEFLYYPKPIKKSHKGMNGVIAVVGGGPYTGAPALSALSSLKTGCDLAYVCCPSHIKNVVASFSPSLIVRGMSGEKFTEENIEEIEDVISRADAILVGPGLGDDAETKKACISLIKRHLDKKYFVVDADAIGSLKNFDCKGRIIITPHKGEFKKLTGVGLPDELYERKKIVMEWAKKLNATILLKGYIDIISDGEKIKINRIHNEAMTAGGTGDVLAGISTALLAKKIKPFNSACLSALINGMAGNLAFEEKNYGMLATDLLEKIPEVIKNYVI